MHWLPCVRWSSTFTFEYLFSLKQKQMTWLIQIESCYLTTHWTIRSVPRSIRQERKISPVPWLWYGSINLSNNISFNYHFYYSIKHHYTFCASSQLIHGTTLQDRSKELALKFIFANWNRKNPHPHFLVWWLLVELKLSYCGAEVKYIKWNCGELQDLLK